MRFFLVLHDHGMQSHVCIHNKRKKVSNFGLIRLNERKWTYYKDIRPTFFQKKRKERICKPSWMHCMLAHTLVNGRTKSIMLLMMMNDDLFRGITSICVEKFILQRVYTVPPIFYCEEYRYLCCEDNHTEI